jgi:hypothetical protein
MKQEDLIVNELYNIEISGEFCHAVNNKGTFNMGSESHKAIFLGKIKISKDVDWRNLFFILSGDAYVMFGCKTIDYVITPKKELNKREMLKQIGVLEKELKTLKLKVI